MTDDCLEQALKEWEPLRLEVAKLQGELFRLGQAMLECWQGGGKVLTAGNGGSAADAIHLAEELLVRYKKNRRALAAIPLTDPGSLTCAGNDFGYDTVFARQVEGLGNPGDILIVFTSTGNSGNILRAIETARVRKVRVAAFLGYDGGKTRGLAEFELLVPSHNTARVQEAHQIMYHSLCQWIDQRVD